MSSAAERTTLTVVEVGRLLGVSRPKLMQLLRDGVVPNVKHGRKYIITRQAFERWQGECGLTGKVRLN